ncbi:eukaryotic translation initiation factor 4E transporter-like [Achroia grisella]|uniref:eukaryotic translation initiation factor 4E transporter-like n=1 Tax=Achroia grisella TaxID=688607 RepID=UPI0027D20146|nr:eukaryotic translation initiation factor 4E transporter-like [Achroia grisella]
MSAVNLLSSLKEKPIVENPNDGPNGEGHDDTQAPSGGSDPAVLAVGPARRPLTYTREELMRLRNSPLVKKGLENAFAGCDALALVLKRRSDSPNEDDRGARGDAPNENHKGVYGRDRERRSADPRERVRKESEPSGGGGGGGGGGGVGIVLSPQRRSFTSGCGAPAAALPHVAPHVARTRPDSPLSAAAPPPAAPHQHHNAPAKPDQAGGRRIGSGRIMVRDVPSGGWEEGEYPRPEPYRPPRDSRANNDRFDRRSFSRDSYSSDIKRERDDRFNNEKTRDREDNRRSGGRFSQRRFEKEDEPEWFSGGPTSQLETIELRGFDEPIKKNTKQNSNNKETEKWNNSGGSRSPAADRTERSERWRDTSSPNDSQPTINANANNNGNSNNSTHNPANENDSSMEIKTEEPQLNNDHPEFNLDDFLKFDSIPDVLTNGGGESEGGSRFSRWFRPESPTNDRHYERLLHNIVDDLDSTTHIEQPMNSGMGGGSPQHVFAPISPAGGPAPAARLPSLLDLLRQANANANANADHRPAMNSAGGKMQSLEELEARLRPQHPSAHHPGPDHDLSAFKRLLAQVSGGHAVPAAEPAPRPPLHHHPHHHHHHHQPHPHHPQQQHASLLQMLNKAADHKHQQPQIPSELLYKLLQVQRQQQQQQQHQQQQPLDLGMHSADRELLQRPEAQAIVHGLKAGEITVQHLIQQLSNPGLQSRHRELLQTILRLYQQRQMGGSPLPGGVAGVAGVGSVGGVAGVTAPHLVLPPHHQPLRLSPLPHPGVPPRIPSPRELVAHTQSIMQGALIKKKLEEQKENFRRRHEMQQQPKQSTPISFTPTSVLRKMTAEKESEAPSPKQQQWGQPLKMPQGRPIVKGNQSGAPPNMAYAPDYQQQYLTQQQQMVGGVRPFPAHSQQRQQVSPQYNNVNNMRGVAGGATLQQLLVQSHQRTLSEMAGGAGSGGGDNQLARWFSPELLARASAGKLPSVHVPNALSLEDLERHHHSPAPPVRN